MIRLPDAFRLDGKVAVVTGGAGTIGTSLCHGLAEVGATVICASRTIEKCRAVADAIVADGGKAIALPLDLADTGSIDRFFERADKETGGVDILVNNAISNVRGHVERYTVEQWEESMAIDGTGFFRITQLALNGMLARGGGNIITIASILGMVAAEERLYAERGGLEGFRPSYFFTKAGVVGFTRFIATAYADKNIRANCVSPGGVQTDPPRADASPFVDRVPMKRLAHADDMKGAVVFLASNASAYVTGHNLVVDGGYTAW